MAIMESVISWMWPRWRFKRLDITVHGQECLDQAHAAGQGVLLIGAHFTCMELVGRYYGSVAKKPLSLTYQPAHDPVTHWWMIRGRRRTCKVVSRKDIRTMIRVLRNQAILWSAPDQDLGKDVSVFVDFFGIPTATVALMPRLAKQGKAAVVLCLFNRKPNDAGYEMWMQAMPEDYPSGDDEQDARAYNQRIEKHIARHPGQYLWTHRRFKTRPEGAASVY